MEEMFLNQMSEIVGSTILLCPFTADFISQTYIDWLNDKSLMQFSRQQLQSHSGESCLRFLESFDGTPNIFWAVLSRDDRLHIGTMTAYVRLAESSADVGILIAHPLFRGVGVGREAWGLALDYLFNCRSLNKVSGGCLERNTAMVRIFQFYGMTLVRTEPQEYLGKTVENIGYYEISRSAWLGR